MSIYLKEFILPTKKRRELLDITDMVNSAVRDSRVSNGMCVVYTPHTTMGIVVNEPEDGLLKDFLSKVSEDFPDNGKWYHNRIDNNAAAHLASMYLGNAKVFIVNGNKLLLGTWQSILAVELDGPRTRRVYVQVMGD